MYKITLKTLNQIINSPDISDDERSKFLAKQPVDTFEGCFTVYMYNMLGETYVSHYNNHIEGYVYDKRAILKIEEMPDVQDNH